MTLEDRIYNGAHYITSKLDATPKIGLILGSGLGDYADRLENRVIIPYADIPDFPVSTVQGHKGQFVCGSYRGKQLIAMQGRFHYYEGYTQQEITIPVRVMHLLGVETLVLTNAAGGIHPRFTGGTLMVITDHINFSGANPLVGPNLAAFGPRFPDMSTVYNKALREQLMQAAKENGISLEQGVYMMFSGPSYETPAEIRMARAMGADAVGMSTVPEAIVANQCKMKTVGISCITNLAAGVSENPLDHQEVMETARRVKDTFTTVLDLLVDMLL